MKQFTITCTLILLCFIAFNACSDDDNTATSGGDSYINGVYQNTENSLKLVDFTFDGKSFNDKSVTFMTEDFKIATISFSGVIDGESETQIKNISIQKSDEAYHFEGSYTSKTQKIVKYSGNITGGAYDKYTLTLVLRNQ